MGTTVCLNTRNRRAVLGSNIMPETKQITFSHKEIATVLVRSAGLHEGIWGLLIEFGIKGMNIGTTEEAGDDVTPAAVVPILRIGLQRFDKETAISVDAAKVNPAPPGEPREDS